MDPLAIRPRRRPAAFGLAMSLGAWLAPCLAGEPSGPTPPPPSAHDGSGALKAQVASAPHDPADARGVLDFAPASRLAAGRPESDPVARAKQMIADCRARYLTVADYTCTFFKRERIDGKLSDQQIMTMKARARPASVYIKFLRPKTGREAIYVQGKHGGKVLAHDVGIGRVVAGTLHLDPRGDMAMEENRHPVTEAGIGALIETVRRRWEAELQAGESTVLFHPQARVGDRACTMIETIHPKQAPQYLFHKVKLYVDRELGLPIRFEAYDWPAHAGQEPELMEEYTYMNLHLNVGLKDRDFDPKNSLYSFGRF